MSLSGPENLGRFTEEQIDELLRDAIGTVDPDRFDELVTRLVAEPPSRLAPVTPPRRRSSPPAGTRWLAVAAALVGVVMAGSLVLRTNRAGEDTASAPAAEATTTTVVASPPMTSASTPSSLVPDEPTPPADFTSRLDRTGATEEERACVQQSSSISATLDCLSLDTLLELQELQLREETDATDPQIDCVLDAVRALGVTGARTLSDRSHAKDIYVACGLPG